MDGGHELLMSLMYSGVSWLCLCVFKIQIGRFSLINSGKNVSFLSTFHGMVGGLSDHLFADAESKMTHKIGGRWVKVGEPGELGIKERTRPLP